MQIIEVTGLDRKSGGAVERSAVALVARMAEYPAVDLWDPQQHEGENCGIPHLAKNERHVGHPATSAGIEPKCPFIPHLAHRGQVV
jgi:hypothetical protein